MPTPLSARAGPLMTGLSSVKTSPKWSMQGRWGAGRGKDEAPGPGTYASEGFHETSRFSRSARFVFGSSTRDGLGIDGGKCPGPGSYTPNTLPVDEVRPRWGFGTSTRDELGKVKGAAPGPGTYSFADTVGSRGGPQYTATPRRNYDGAENARRALPGPGAYSEVGKAKEAVNIASPRWGFGTSVRQPLASATQAPGPGAYRQSNTLGSAAPKYSMGARRVIPDNTKGTPGPGAHGGAFTQFGY